MSAHVVNVTIQGRRITVDKDPVTIHRDSSVEWHGNESFTIKFQDPGPFGAKLSHADARRPNQPKAGFTGTYKYTIISDQDNSIELDPVVIIGPGLTGQ